MAERTRTETTDAPGDADDAAAGALAKREGAPVARPSPLQIGLRVLIGFAGLSLLVGFFLPWWNVPHGTGEGATIEAMTGLSLATSGDLAGSPSMLLFLIPALGIALSATAFMGFKWSGHVAVGVSVALIGYALYVLLQMFVQRTALGLWIVAGGTFVILLLGVIAWLTGREPKKGASATEPEPESAAP